MIKDYTQKPTLLKAIKLNKSDSNEIMHFTDNRIDYCEGFWGWRNNNFSRQFRDGDYVCKYDNGEIFLLEKTRFEAQFVEKN